MRINLRKKKISRDRAREGGRERAKERKPGRERERERELISYSLSECSTQIKCYLPIISDDRMSALANAASQWKQQWNRPCNFHSQDGPFLFTQSRNI